VSFKVLIFCEGFFAYDTFVWFPAFMRIVMNVQPLSSLVSLSAKSTLVKLLTRMDHVVPFKQAISGKFLVAVLKIAQKRSISSVTADMYFKITGLLKFLQAI